MRVLMLGWEFPPVISGGLGTACYGLTKALAKTGVEIIFVLPRCPEAESFNDVELIGLRPPLPTPPPAPLVMLSERGEQVSSDPASSSGTAYAFEDLPTVEFVKIDAQLRPYRRPGERYQVAVTGRTSREVPAGPVQACVPQALAPQGAILHPEPPPFTDDLFREVERYAHQATQAVTGKAFDVVHAHDWMTYPAAEAIAEMSGRPFIAHVHSTEFDRSGQRIDQRIYDLERAGLHRAALVIAVSHMTRGILMSRYGVPEERISVIYSAVDADGPLAPAQPKPPAIEGDEKIVLFLGRITMQKGPEYFLAAARKVLQVYDRVRFVMAGSGDMIRRTMTLASEMGIGDKVLFTGFLRGRDVERIFRSADLYVMPSVSEPFGIASLEAVSYDVPVLMSKQSGASEVLRHVLKVDFWDIEEMANKIVAVLRHPPLHATLKTQARYEVRRLSWADSARRCTKVYESALAAVRPKEAAHDTAR